MSLLLPLLNWIGHTWWALFLSVVLFFIICGHSTQMPKKFPWEKRQPWETKAQWEERKKYIEQELEKRRLQQNKEGRSS